MGYRAKLTCLARIPLDTLQIGDCMYTHKNFRTKKALKQAIASDEVVRVYQPGPWPAAPQLLNGTVYLEGPHYPASPSWYAQGTLVDGRLVSVK